MCEERDILKTVALATALAAWAFAAQAECVMRTSSLTKVAGQLDEIADVRPMLMPAGNGELKCSISVRVLYHGKWDTAFGEYTGDQAIGGQELCVNAVEIALRQYLASKEAKLLHSDQQMVCTDEDPIKPVATKPGDVVRLSQLALDTSKPEFEYKGATCKWFLETKYQDGDLAQYNGIACRIRKNSDDWTVIDQFIEVK